MTKDLTKKDVAEALNMSVSYIDKLVCRRKIPYYKQGRAVRFSEAKIEEWKKTREVKKAS